MQSQNFIGGSLVMSKGGITGLSGAATTYTTGAAIVYAIYGKMYSKAAVAGGATPTTDGVTGLAMTVAVGYGSNITWCLDASGTVYALQGSSEILDQSGNFRFANPQFPAIPDTMVPFAYAIVKNSPTTGTGVFTFGVSNWNQTGVTVTATDLMAIPNRPQSV